MAELLSTVRGALVLNIPTFVRFRDDEDVFRRGVTLLVLVALVVGAVAFLVGLVGAVLAGPPSAELPAGFDQMLEFLPPEAAKAFEGQFLENFAAGIEIGARVEALDTRLPKPVGKFFEAFSVWPHRPLNMLGGFLAYGIWVMLAAKLLGGTGRIQEFLGTAALSAVPYLLLVLEWIPCLGGLLGLVAWVWSTVIWVAATAVSHGWAQPVTTDEGEVARYQVSWGKAALAVLLPALVLFVLVMVGVIVLAVVVAVAAGGS
jgi:hypothetical protein